MAYEQPHDPNRGYAWAALAAGVASLAAPVVAVGGGFVLGLVLGMVGNERAMEALTGETEGSTALWAVMVMLGLVSRIFGLSALLLAWRARHSSIAAVGAVGAAIGLVVFLASVI